MSKKIKIGIMPLDDFKKRTLAIVQGKYKPDSKEPKIWFNSMRSLANVLSQENQDLLRLILEAEPQSIAELEPLTGRKANNILRTLRTMENCGLVKLVAGAKGNKGRTPLVPKVLYQQASIELNFGLAD